MISDRELLLKVRDSIFDCTTGNKLIDVALALAKEIDARCWASGIHIEAEDGDHVALHDRARRIVQEVSALVVDAERVRDQHRRQVDGCAALLTELEAKLADATHKLGIAVATVAALTDLDAIDKIARISVITSATDIATPGPDGDDVAAKVHRLAWRERCLAHAVHERDEWLRIERDENLRLVFDLLNADPYGRCGTCARRNCKVTHQ